MNNFSDDELLSAIIDGEADPDAIASIEADDELSERLSNMRAGVELVAEPVSPASPEARASSIAAALAAATSAAPEVVSLAAERHNREEKKRSISPVWFAAAAAVLLFVLALPVVFGIGGGDVTSVAESADEAVLDDVAADAVEETEEASAADAASSAMVEQQAVEEESAEEEVAEQAEAMEDEPASDDSGEIAAGTEEAPVAELTDVAPESTVELDLEVVQSLDELDELIEQGVVVAGLTSDDIVNIESSLAREASELDEALSTGVNPECFAGSSDPLSPSYDLVVIDPFAGAPSLVIVEFGPDSTTRVLDAETCEVIR